jgi:hypothetical protein
VRLLLRAKALLDSRPPYEEVNLVDDRTSAGLFDITAAGPSRKS